ncbi:unnamed protein product [Owenia fusiformis]|uniref:Sushi domain-containing protein n=1 Tax=Owenia fusiformis TaxID=6347 RepID=A0A8S4NG96_OWEFU|nr:unnamed protein product [Owenia fusiformis]
MSYMTDLIGSTNRCTGNTIHQSVMALVKKACILLTIFIFLCKYAGAALCKEPKEPKNGKIRKLSGLEFMDSVSYMCNKDYRMVKGSRKATCQEDGKWKPSITPVCDLWSNLDIDIGDIEPVSTTNIPNIQANYIFLSDEFLLSVNDAGSWLGEGSYIRHNLNKTTKVGFLQRRRDPITNDFHVPRAIRRYIIDDKVRYNGKRLNPAKMSISDLYGFMSSLEIFQDSEKIDPFRDHRRYDPSGNFCHCEIEADCDCVISQDDMFKDLSGTSTDYCNEYYNTPLRPISGDEDWIGAYKRKADDLLYEFQHGRTDIFHEEVLVNKQTDRISGQPKYRFSNEEVEEVFYLEARIQRNFEVHNGVSMEIWGWRGGKVEDFKFDEYGNLINGFIVVGPHPRTDYNDVVYYNQSRCDPENNINPGECAWPYSQWGYSYMGCKEVNGTIPEKCDMSESIDGNNYTYGYDKSPWRDLEVRTPGPQMKFTDGKRTRIYVYNNMEHDWKHKISVHWHGMDLPHDQDGVAFETHTPIEVDATWVYEYQIPNIGSRWYHQHYNTPDTVGMGMFGPVSTSFPDDITTWDREYTLMVHDGQGRFTMNGNSFPGTVRRLSGWFKDQIRIKKTETDENGDTIVTIVDEPRADFSVPLGGKMCPTRQKYNSPASGAPIRPGTGYTGSGLFGDTDKTHNHRGHNILCKKHGIRVQIAGVNEPTWSYPYTTVNGRHYVTRVDDTKLRIKKIGVAGTVPGSGGILYIWRKHKSSLEEPYTQNSGNSASYVKGNDGEEVAMRWHNAALTPHPLHIHGHQWRVIGVDGNLDDAPQIHNVYLIPQAGTFDTTVAMNNPNCFGAWVMHCHNLQHIQNSDNPWRGGVSYPGGMFTLIDYTGFGQGKNAISHLFVNEPFNTLPPDCKARDDVKAGKDILGEAAVKGKEYVRLGVDATYGTDLYKKKPFGDIVGYKWTIDRYINKEGKSGHEIALPKGSQIDKHQVLNGSNPQVTGFDVSGDYHFKVDVIGKHSERDNEDDETHCYDYQEVNYDSELLIDDRNHPAITEHGKFTNLKLQPGVERGHVTYPMYKATLRTGVDELIVETSNNVQSNDISGTYRAQVSSPSNKVYINMEKSCSIGRVELDARITTHGTPLGVNLIPGEDIGTITQALHVGKFGSRKIYFTVTDVSHKEWAEKYSTVFSPVLADAPDEACELDATYNSRTETFTFTRDAGFVARIVNGKSVGPVGNPDYSPLKRVVINGETITLNMPFVKWGDEDGQMLIVDNGGCDPLIRSILPSPKWKGDGPRGCTPDEGALERYNGGQALEIDIDNARVVMKLHKATLRDDGIIPYYTVFEASKFPAAGNMGNVLAPKLELLGRGDDERTNDAVRALIQLGNGVPIRAGGPASFQAGIVPFSAHSAGYTPMWHIVWLFYNCGFMNGMKWDNVVGEDASEFLEGFNNGVDGSKLDSSDEDFDPFQLSGGIKNNACPGYAKKVTGNKDGLLYLGEEQALLEKRQAFLTDSPGGNPLSKKFGKGPGFMIVNCPMPVTVDMNCGTSPFSHVDSKERVGEWQLYCKDENGITTTVAKGDNVADIRQVTWSENAGISSVTLNQNLADKPVYFIMTDSENKELGDMFGGAPSPVLSEAPLESVEYIALLEPLKFNETTGETNLVFYEDPGYVAREEGGKVLPPVGNPNYSPLKRFLFKCKTVTINIPFMQWGDEPGQKLIEDHGGCDPLIRSVPPSPKWKGNGPPGCDSDQTWQKRYKGGQALKIDVSTMQATIKTHKATLRDDGIIPYYIALEASKAPAAGFMGTILAPKMEKLGRGDEFRTNDAVRSLIQFANGIAPEDGGGPNAFQPGVVPFGASSAGYTPMWHILWFFYNCANDASSINDTAVSDMNEGGNAFMKGRNAGFDGSELNPSDDPFDPFQMNGGIKNAKCKKFAQEANGNEEGIMYLDGEKSLMERNLGIVTDSPPGNPFNKKFGRGPGFMIVNCPIPITVNMNDNVPEKSSDPATADGRIVRLIGTDNVDFWFLKIGDSPAIALDRSTIEDIQEGKASTVQLREGDTLIVEVTSGGTGHGFVLHSMHLTEETAEQACLEMFDVEESPIQPSKFSSSSFVHIFKQDLFGVTGSHVARKIFMGTVRRGVVGKRLGFVCPIHGPKKMNGILEIISA